jgi:hypothetical protein
VSDQEIEQYVEGLADRVPAVPAPLGAVLVAGRAATARRARRRGVGVLVGVAAAVGAVVLGPQLVVQQAPIEVLGGGGAVVEPAVADGTRLVGAEGVAIAVPEGWVSVDAPFCQAPRMPYVYVAEERPYASSCPYDPDDSLPASSLEISAGPATRSQPESGAATTMTLPTGERVVTAGSCVDIQCWRRWKVGGVTFSAYVVDEGARAIVDRMSESLRAVPAGHTTVPGWPFVLSRTGPGTSRRGPLPRAEYVELLEAAGLRAYPLDVQDDVLPAPAPGIIDTTSPGYGSVVPRGTLVLLDPRD